MTLRHCFAILLAATLVSGFQEAGEIDRWISELIHSDPAIRTKAEKSLLKAGPKALPQLKLAFESKTPELSGRAKFIASEIERIEFERQHDAAQRPRRLEIVTLQVKDAPLGDVLKALQAQVDSTFHTTIDAKQKLTIDVKEVPLRKCLDQMEDLLKATIVSKFNWHRVNAGAPVRKKRAYAPGATFDFTLAKFQQNGQPAGYALTTESSGTATVYVDSVEAVDAQKAAVEVERCGRCSPRFTHLKTDKAGPFTIRLKGRVVWESPYELSVNDPARAQDFRVGQFAVRYEWPKVMWTTNEPVPPQVIGRAELSGKLKKQAQTPGAGGPMGVATNPPLERFANSWCACSAGPTPLMPPSTARIGGGSHFEGAFQARKPDQFEWVKVRFYKAIEEPFETEAVVAAE